MASSEIDEPKLPGGYLVTPRVPQGLAAAVEGLTREVIRHSPEDIYVFAADHFEKLLLLREQCDVGKDKPPEGDGNIRTLREISRALRMREIDRGNARPTRNTIDQMGWSLSQTAKVLKRHRSIFGEEGRRITTDEVFRMANQKENLASSEKSPERATESREKRSSRDKSSNRLGGKDVWKASTSKNERSSSNEDSLDSSKTHRARKTGPRIITQIPNLLAKDTTMRAKDIKSELRRNRISSRERRSVRAKPEDKINVDRSDVKVTKTSGKSTSSKKSSERQRRLETEIEQKRGRKYTDSTRLSKERRSDDGRIEENSKTRALSMDRVKDYVVQRFATTRSLEELQPANYVEQVQEIIDETSPIIKEKIEELKSGIMGGSERNTWFEDERKDRSSGSNDSSREKRDTIANSKNSPEIRESSGSGDALRTRLTETEKLLENLSTSLGRSKRRSRSARSLRGSESIERKINEENSRELNDSRLDSDNLGLATSLSKTRDLLENISSTMTRPMRRASSAKNLRKNQSTMENLDDSFSKDLLKKRLDETRNLLRGISATFGRSAKGSKKQASLDVEESELSNIETKSKVCLPAVKSISMRNSSGSASRSDSDNLVLPAISPEAPKSAKIKEDFILPVLSPSANASTNENSSRIGDANDELRFDEIDIPEIPVKDYALKIPIDNVSRDSLNVTPDFDSIPQRPDSLDPPDIIDDPEAKTMERNDLETKVSEADLRTKVSKGDLEAKVSEVNDLESEINDARDLEPRLGEIQTVEKVIASKSPEMEISDIRSKLREIEEAEKRIDGIFDAEIHEESEKSNKGDSPVEIEENVASKSEDRRIDELKSVSPEILDYTYVLTEGSPHDIPDTVTTVIIPDRTQYSPLSDRINVDLQNGREIEVSEITDVPRKKSIDTDVEVVDFVEADIDDDTKNSTKLSSVDIEERANIAVDESTKNLIKSVEEDSSSKDKTDIFGEYVKLESTVENSDEIDFIREIEDRQEIQKSRQDLGRINEEMSEDLEGIDEHEEAKKIVENVVKSEEGSSKEIVDGKIVEEESKENDEDRKSVVDEPEAERSRLRIESDLSPEATRPDIDSESSNEAKESSAAEDASESMKREHSMEDEISTDTRTIESSNEVKETTLTDGLSLSLDPTRPFVPELNLDSLQDITVSSFKMTEDDYQNNERGESENTNSITDTLASDENNRIIDNGDFVDEAIMEYFVSSSNREGRENSEKEIVEDTIVKSQVEIKEDICEKTSTYVTGPCDENESSAEQTSRDIPTMEKDKEEITKTEDSIEHESLEIANMDEDEDKTLREDEEMAKTEDSIKQESPEIAKMEKEEDKTLREDEEEMTKIEDTIKQENLEILKTEKEEDETLQEDKEESTKIENSIEQESSKIVETEEEEIVKVVEEEITKVADSNEQEDEKVVATKKEEEDASKEGEEVTKTEETVEVEKVEIVQLEKIENEAEEEIKESTKIEESNENKDVGIMNIEKNGTKDESQEKIEREKPVTSSDEKFEVDVTIKKVEQESDLENQEMQVKEKIENDLERAESAEASTMRQKSVEKMTEETVDEENEDILEENFVEEETPLAVSRSASQCTTRRVSSGNLTKLREDPISGWTEETEREGDNVDDETSSSSRVKLFKIGDETIEEQSCEEIDLNFENNEIDDANTKDSKEYHIYVPEVNASADNSTTDSSTFDSAVTKIQAGVRGFLTRRRLQRGQQNRSSTLSSIPSIQDSIAIEPYWTSDREPDGEQVKESGNEEMRISPRNLEDNGVVNAATRIQSNYRGCNVRKRLRREDAVQRTTLSLEKSFAESGLQHTGEFHDCVPLPIHDIALKDKTLDAQKDSSEIQDPKPTDDEIASSKSPPNDSPKDSTPRDHDNVSDTLMPIDAGKMFFGQSSTVPIIQLGIDAPNMSQLVDLVVLAKEEASLQSGYLNFITSVEDTEPIISSVETPLKDFHENDKNSSGSLKEPLALSGPSIGVTIEEVTSSGAENFMKNDDEHDRTMASSLSVTTEPEVVNVSSETISIPMEGHQPESDSLPSNEAGVVDNGSSRPVEKIDEVFDKPDKKSDDLARKTSSSSNVEEVEKNVDENESLLEYFAVSSPSSPKKKPLFGPESSTDSMESPVVRTHVEGTSGSPDLRVEETNESGVSPVTESSIRSESMDEKAKQEESIDSNVDETSSMLSFSMKVDDLLGLGSEDSVESHCKKPFLQVNLTPSDVLKTMSSSQESQLADERIESPITMIQIAPGRSESLQQDEISENGGENDATNEKKVSEPDSAESVKK